MDFIRHHPFAVSAHFRKVVALSFAFPEAVLLPLLPPDLALDTCAGMGFLTVALVWTERLRPSVFPAFLGQDFFLSGYRIFTRLRAENGRRLRGLKILRSETDRQRMVWSGNLLTKYNYRLVKVSFANSEGVSRVLTNKPDGTAALDLSWLVLPENQPVKLPPGSPFPDWKTARQFAGPMPFTFSEEPGGRFVVIEGRRESWKPRPVEVLDWRVAMFGEKEFRGVTPVLANAFTVENVDYRWEKGRLIVPGAAS